MSDTLVGMDIVRTVLAGVHHWCDEDCGETYCLQIELGNDRGITLTISEKDRPSVNIWNGSGEHSLTDETLDGFREFVAAAFERQGASP